ncbi:uncharacterized protein BUCNMO_111 [Buchnera aphidicola (Nipponaphis monzeni)]|uniref:VTT domain-containing protein n=1 Tax=Buchnera aphidicola (Nipponaphis monzeni) TaxID=2495405 RepID=A0A455T9W3_9GAMM|nr:DedA family protein [Buchnera aphidicola]BBI01126.1 uncharacterized protein BUCNMO_111 [Buchnera aphidicola (Nipponaphis monzeni)]
MESWLTYFTTQSLEYSLIIIVIVSFLESFAFVGLLLPGIVLMTALGTLIGQEKVSFYPAWISGFIGCLLGDWISFYIGCVFKSWLHNLFFFKKHFIILKKIKKSLYYYSFLTIFIGRFIGPTRPLVPIISGMLQLPLKKFILPNILGCLFWPPVYFFPGIFTGLLMHTPYINRNNYFLPILIIVLIVTWIGFWLIWRWKQLEHNKFKYFNISKKNLLVFAVIMLIIGISGLILIQFCKEMFILRQLIWKILFTM